MEDGLMIFVIESQASGIGWGLIISLAAVVVSAWQLYLSRKSIQQSRRVIENNARDRFLNNLYAACSYITDVSDKIESGIISLDQRHIDKLNDYLRNIIIEISSNNIDRGDAARIRTMISNHIIEAGRLTEVSWPNVNLGKIYDSLNHYIQKLESDTT